MYCISGYFLLAEDWKKLVNIDKDTSNFTSKFKLFNLLACLEVVSIKGTANQKTTLGLQKCIISLI